ncbi:MAG: DUF1491 family protein [Proteobacteria bacterium]|jgi:hypothetical protein|nr:DUF1491 family protein [Alphaproteobacteria bacterium]NCC02826.1 DUF1491 family protein [Pseudomonadota bacterium]
MAHLPTGIIVSAAIRQASKEGVSIYVLHKGDQDTGAILIKLNFLDGRAQLFTQTTLDDLSGWLPATAEPIDEAETQTTISQFLKFDPDLWVIEIEDREGRLWIEGKILDFLG